MAGNLLTPSELVAPHASPASIDSRALTSDANPWRSFFRDNLLQQPEPVFTHSRPLGSSTTIPAASVWNGSRHWTTAFRTHNIVANDSIAIALPAGPVFAEVLIAAFRHDLTVVLTAPDTIASLPANVRVLIAEDSQEDSAQCVQLPVWGANGISGPQTSLESPRTVANIPGTNRATPCPRLLARRGDNWMAYNDEMIIALMRSVTSSTGVTAQTILTGPQWHDLASLVMGLLAPIAMRASHVITGIENDAACIDAAINMFQPDRVLLGA
jgi:hypothetical protein